MARHLRGHPRSHPRRGQDISRPFSPDTPSSIKLTQAKSVPHSAKMRGSRCNLIQKWRPEPESNRRARICSPLRNHSAIGPHGAMCGGRRRKSMGGATRPESVTCSHPDTPPPSARRPKHRNSAADRWHEPCWRSREGSFHARRTEGLAGSGTSDRSFESRGVLRG